VLDIELDHDLGLIYTAGAGGLFTLRHTGQGLETLSVARAGGGGGGGGRGGGGGDFDRLEALGDGLVAVSRRETGWWVFDANDPTRVGVIATVPEPGASGMARRGDRLYVLHHEGRVLVYDLTDPTQPQRVGEVGGLGNPWEITITGQRAYVADNALGVVVLDLAEPDAPVVVSTVETLGAAQDLWVDGERLYVAVGGEGIEFLSLVDPDVPVSVASVDYGPAIVSVSAAGDLVWGANHVGVVVADASDFEAPVPLGTEATEVWAMHVVAHRDGVYLADWNQAGYFAYDTALPRAPEAELSRSSVPVVAGVEDATVALANRGGAPLVISGVEVNDPRFTVELDRLEVASGSVAQLRVTFADDGEPVDAELCLATNDPDQPLQRVTLASSSTGSDVAVGESAPDFVLTDLDGNQHQLSEQLGSPVVLVYFATW